MKDRYTFGDNDAAADRLALLAHAYEPSSAAFLEWALARVLERVPPSRPPRAVDLGSGPGYTTALLHRALGSRETWGLDASERLVARARAEFGASLRFAVHDVTEAPYPLADVDVFYARYLFTHLASPTAVLEATAAAAAPGGTFIIEDNCALESPDPLFSDYYARVRTMHAHYGQNMFVGERLPELAGATPWAIEHFARTRIGLDARVMARLHSINVGTWRHDPFAASAFDGGEIDAMVRALEAVAAGERDAPDVTCTMGQMVLRV
ncbi:MAG TPA: class I SAM-dependent methyltransferase [Polyangiaceae bacterium]